MTEIDSKYLREKNVAAILETIAAEIVVQKPGDPEAFLRERFADAKEESFKSGDSVVLYVTPLCPFSATALLALTFSKVPFQTVEIAEGAPMPTEFSSSSAFGRCPALGHNGLVVVEVGPVVRYACFRTNAYPNGSLRQKAKVESAFDMVHNHILLEAFTAVNERVFSPRKFQRPVDNISVQASATRFRSALSQLQSCPTLFEESHWLVGGAPTIADFALAGAVFSMQNVAGFDCVTGLEKISKWWAATQAEWWFSESLRSFVAAAGKLYSR